MGFYLYGYVCIYVLHRGIKQGTSNPLSLFLSFPSPIIFFSFFFKLYGSICVAHSWTIWKWPGVYIYSTELDCIHQKLYIEERGEKRKKAIGGYWGGVRSTFSSAIFVFRRFLFFDAMQHTPRRTSTHTLLHHSLLAAGGNCTRLNE